MQRHLRARCRGCKTLIPLYDKRPVGSPSWSGYGSATQSQINHETSAVRLKTSHPIGQKHSWTMQISLDASTAETLQPHFTKLINLPFKCLCVCSPDEHALIAQTPFCPRNLHEGRLCSTSTVWFVLFCKKCGNDTGCGQDLWQFGSSFNLIVLFAVCRCP